MLPAERGEVGEQFVFRQADGAWATALADDTVAADPAALAGARVFTTVRVDALLDTVAAAIRQHCPACPAVTGGEALKRRSIAAREIA